MEESSKRRMESHPNEDRISALPDSVIHHILSFLPSTKQAIRTGILSKRWRDQWTHVPVLILKSYDVSGEDFIKYTENVLLSYNSVKIKKFYFQFNSYFRQDPNFDAKIRFATRRNVEDLTLEYNSLFYEFPQFIFKLASLVRLCSVRCSVNPNKKVGWECLRELCLSGCKLSKQAIENILSGSPLLESLELQFCKGFVQLSVFSNSLKRLVVDQQDEVLDISCPILEELTVGGARLKSIPSSSLLKSLELCRCDYSSTLSITSESLRRLVLKDIIASAIDILCPNLKELKLEDLKDVGTLQLKDVPYAISSASNLTINWTKGSIQWS